MSFWDKIQEDISKNLKEGLSIFKEGSEVVSQKIEWLTDEGKKKYKTFNLNMKVQEEFAKLGGLVYDLTAKKSKNPLGNKKVAALMNKIKKMESDISKLESKDVKKPKKKTVRKKTAVRKKTTKKTVKKAVKK